MVPSTFEMVVWFARKGCYCCRVSFQNLLMHGCMQDIGLSLVAREVLGQILRETRDETTREVERAREEDGEKKERDMEK